MSSFKPSTSRSPQFLELIRAIAGANQAISIFEAAAHRNSGNNLTTSQANVIFTLGNTDGLTCADIGSATLITKGTLTGVIDRLIAKGLVERWEDAYDARRTIIALTSKGTRVFQNAFPDHVSLLKSKLAGLSVADQRRVTSALEQIEQAFTEN